MTILMFKDKVHVIKDYQKIKSILHCEKNVVISSDNPKSIVKIHNDEKWSYEINKFEISLASETLEKNVISH